MNRQYIAAVMRDEDRWLGWIEEVPGIHCHEHSREALQSKLTVMLQESLHLDPQETLNGSAIYFKDLR